MEKEYVISRYINGIYLNQKEYILEDDNKTTKKFSREQAETIIRDNNLEEIAEVEQLDD